MLNKKLPHHFDFFRSSRNHFKYFSDLYKGLKSDHIIMTKLTLTTNIDHENAGIHQ
jgi:hypothetical protein